MLSKKMAFSLTSLIIFALAFVAPFAMAGEFGVSLLRVTDGTTELMDVSHDDGLQVERPTTTVNAVIKFDKAVVLAADNISVSGYDMDGNFLPTTVLNAGTPIAPTTAATEITVAIDIPDVGAISVAKVTLKIAKGIASADALNDDTSKELKTDIHLLDANPASGPDVLKIAMIGEPFATVTTAEFQAHILLSEEPKGGLVEDLIELGELDFGSLVKLASPGSAMTIGDAGLVARTGETLGGTDGINTLASWRDGNLHLYLLTVKTKLGEKTATIRVKNFLGKEQPTGTLNQETYVRASDSALVEGRDKLTAKTNITDPAVKAAGTEYKIGNEKRIPKDGYLVVATNIGGSGVKDNPENDKDEPKASARTPAQLLYNVIELGLPNLETFLANGGTIDVVGPEKVVISEIMWGTDASLAPNNNSQWIELKNMSGKSLLTGDGNYKFVFYGPNEAPPAKVAVAAVAETATTKAQPAGMALPSGVQDRIGTIDEKGIYWSIVGKGQSGRSGVEEQAADIVATVPTQAIVSMYRASDADGMPMNGQMASSWMQSTPPGVNFDVAKVGVRIGSPGAARLVTAAEAAAEAAAAKAKADADAAAAAKAADISVSVPAVGQIYISEVMFAGGGTLPQWIEISNGSRTEQVNLSGWTLTVNNAAADADVSVGASIKFTIPEGTKIDPSGQNDTPSTLLVVTEAGRNNMPAGAPMLNIWESSQTELILAGVTKRRYSLLSDMAFEIVLAPPAPTAIKVAATATNAEKAAAKAADATAMLAHKAATDMAGNLGADGAAAWALPMSEDGRSSIIRGHVPVSVGPAEPEDGTMMASWALASDTAFAQVTHIRASSYYGAQTDSGTPGFRAGGALPVELSHFRPARQKETGAVVITWSTQSELNNAGFFIKRSQQRDGEFKVINATMIAGAGTSSEKQFYTYTDTTAQPNVVYYYQIEDVSLDGNRQTLTRGIRLKGHVGAAGKATTLWGELKTSHE